MEKTVVSDSACSTISLTIALSNNRHEDFHSLERLVSNGRGVREGSTSPFITDTIGLRNSGQIFLQIALLFLVVFFICSLPSNVFAVPACPRPFELKQPSGKTFEARQHGDEWYNWVETNDGYGIYKNTETGYWEYYVPSDETPKKEQKFRIGRKQDTKKRTIVSEVDPATLGIPKGLRPPKKEDGRPWKPTKPKTSPQTTPHPSPLPQGERESTLPQEERKHTERLGETDDSPLERGAGGVFERPKKQPPESPFVNGDSGGFHAKKSSTSTAVSGTMHLLVIGVDYATTTATYTPSQVQALAFGASSSVADYYSDVSYSSVTVDPATESHGTANDGFIGWLRLSGSHPNTGSNVGNTNMQIAKDAILAADSYIDFASYDTDGDGIVEPTELAIVIIVAGYETSYGSGSSPSVWAHYGYNSSRIASVDGKTIQKYAEFGEKHGDHLATFGVIVHELGHLMFSLPDLYDTDYYSNGIGYFDLMGAGGWGAASGAYSGSSPTHLSAWSKEYLSWGTVNTITSSQTVSLPKADGNKSSIFRIHTQDSNQYFLLENREFSDYDIGFQRATGASGHGGLVIYHVDKLKTEGIALDWNRVNEIEVHKGVDVEEANEGSLGYSMLDSNESNADTNMFFFSGNNTSFTNNTIPDSRLKNGGSTHVSVTDVSAYGDTMTAAISLPTTQAIIVSTDSATNSKSSVTLQGTVNTNGITATVWFEYGTASSSYNGSTSTQTISSTTSTTASATISGLPPYTTYYYKLVARTSDGTLWDGNERKFTLWDAGITVTPKISGGDFHTLVLKSDSTAWTWGYNRDGQLGDLTNTDRNAPVQVNSISGVIAIAAGGSCGGAHNLALRSDGTVWVWGSNYYGELGDGTNTNRDGRTNANKSDPVQVKSLSGTIAIAAGGYISFVLKSDGTVWGWGYGGWVGDETYTNRSTPVQVKNIRGVIDIAAGGYYGLALKSDGTVWAWGDHPNGQLGDGSTVNRTTPVQVDGLSNVIAIAGGVFHALALKSDGTVWAWGGNRYGQLGDGTTTDRLTPVQVSGLSNSIAIDAGEGYSLALKSDGTVWTWGKGGYLGDGTYTNKSTPIQVNSLDSIASVACGWYHSLALKSDGTVWAWGANYLGQCGDGTTEDKATPVQVNNINLGETPTDNIAPTGSININNGDSYTTSTAVTLNLSATDVYGVTGHYLSTSSTTPLSSDPGWTSVSSAIVYSGRTASYTLSSGEGPKTVYAWYKNTTGNVSSPVSDSIVLDETVPTVTIAGPTSDSTYTTISGTLSLAGSASDSGSGISSVTWSNSKGGNGTASGTTSWSVSSVSLSSGENVITVTATDGAGYTATDTITVTYTTSTLCEARSMEVSKNRVVLRRGRNREVTVSVKGISGCPVEGIETEATVNDGGKLISVSPVIQATDEGGEGVFTITAKNSTGEARITFKAGDLEKTLNVKVRR